MGMVWCTVNYCVYGRGGENVWFFHAGKISPNIDSEQNNISRVARENNLGLALIWAKFLILFTFSWRTNIENNFALYWLISPVVMKPNQYKLVCLGRSIRIHFICHCFLPPYENHFGKQSYKNQYGFSWPMSSESSSLPSEFSWMRVRGYYTSISIISSEKTTVQWNIKCEKT